MIPSLDPGFLASLPSRQEMVRTVADVTARKGSAVDVLRGARGSGRPALQPRCGVGAHRAMLDLLTELEEGAAPDLLTVTIDSHTRLRRFAVAARTLRENPSHLNGYPLVTHGWRRGLELNAAVGAPLQIRHGSPDARELFVTAVAAGITSFEGGGISYNLPYSKDVPLETSLAAWHEVDRACGVLYEEDGVIVDRELFGTLTAVLVPPSVSLAVTLLEAVAAADAGVRCVSISYPQGGNAVQDVAALRALPVLAAVYLPPEVEVFPVLHQFMGAFPRQPAAADALILYGALVGRMGGAAKIVTKTNQEAHGIPDSRANVDGLRTAALAGSEFLDFLRLDEPAVEEEVHWIVREVRELVDPVLAAAGPAPGGTALAGAVADAFRRGTLDIPFSASRHAKSDVLPGRDGHGAIRYRDAGALPFSAEVLRRNAAFAGQGGWGEPGMIPSITADIGYFLTERAQTRTREASPSR
ncbi:methylaspartate mutase [Streptomyces sp.]|uniref:methylaspartate mutase n=1 Tax=Streptomyces sp. TaxID=1931 RepID=UPI002F41FE41